MKVRALFLLPWFAAAAAGQTVCAPTPAYSPCEIVFEMTAEDIRAHPNPYATVTVDVEFRSPRFRTDLLPAYWDGGGRIVARFSPTDAGTWEFRVSSNLPDLDGRRGKFHATASSSPGFVSPRNVHHWGYTGGDQPHLWMGDTNLRFAVMDQGSFDRLVETRARQKFNHLRGLVLGGPQDAASAFPDASRPDVAYFRRLDERIKALNKAGLVADLILAGEENQLTRLFPSRLDRERYVRYIVARYAAFHVTWQGIWQYEKYEGGRELLREIGALLKRLDPYNHPRSTDADVTSAALAGDGWMTFIIQRTADVALGAIEHQLHAMPFVNTGAAVEADGPDLMRKRLWLASMNGHYPTFVPAESGAPDQPAAGQMTVWFDFFSRTRYWELEPFFDVDGGRALALEVPRSEDDPPEGIEYVIYLEKPGAVEAALQRQNYDVAWLNPMTGERLKQSRFRGDRLRMQSPGASQDWVLHVSREEKKRGMLRSYKFESRAIRLQEVEQNAQHVPFEIVEPSAPVIRPGQPARFAARVTRDTRATRSMLWLWTGEVSADGAGYRVLGSGLEGEMRVPESIASRYPAVLNVRLAGMNALGKVYFLDKVFRLER